MFRLKLFQVPQIKSSISKFSTNVDSTIKKKKKKKKKKKNRKRKNHPSLIKPGDKLLIEEKNSFTFINSLT